jgi:hypothetical protein
VAEIRRNLSGRQVHGNWLDGKLRFGRRHRRQGCAWLPGSGGIQAVNFKEIKTQLPDLPHSKMIVVFGDDTLETIQSHIQAVIKELGFRNWQWELYKSSNAHVYRDGAVINKYSQAPIPRLRVFISQFAHKLK